MKLNYLILYVFLALSLVNLPSEFIQIFPFTFIIAVCFGLSQMVKKEYFQVFIEDIKYPLMLMIVSSFSLMFISEVQIPELVSFAEHFSFESALKVVAQFNLIFALIQIIQKAHLVTYYPRFYMTQNIIYYMKSIPFVENYQKISIKNVQKLKPKNKFEQELKDHLLNTYSECKNSIFYHQSLYNAWIDFIYTNHPVLKNWKEVDSKIKRNLQQSDLKPLFTEDGVIIPPLFKS